MRKLPTFIFGIIQLVISAIISGLVYYLLSDSSVIGFIITMPIIAIGIILAYVFNMSGGIKLILTSFSKSKTIKICSIILSIVAVLLLCFNGHNVATFINSLGW